MDRLHQQELSPLLDPRKPEHHARLAELHAQSAYLLEPNQKRKASHVQKVIDSLGRMLQRLNAQEEVRPNGGTEP